MKRNHQLLLSLLSLYFEHLIANFDDLPTFLVIRRLTIFPEYGKVCFDGENRGKFSARAIGRAAFETKPRSFGESRQ